MGRRTTWTAGWAVVSVALAAAAVAGARSGAARIALRQPLPSVVRVHERVLIAGHVRGESGPVRAAVQAERVQPSSSSAWTTLASAPVGAAGAFRLHWHVHASAFNVIRLRVAIVRGGQVLDVAGTRTTSVGPAVMHCKPPPVLNALLPMGDGRIVGGVYIVGGPAPGVDQCDSGSHVVEALDAAGVVVAHEPVSHRRSYALVVPAGMYQLTAAGSSCHGSARVTAGTTTRADVVCDVP